MKKIFVIAVVLCFCCAGLYADTFKHRVTGATFEGYPTQRSMRGQRRVYAFADGKYTSKMVDMSEYDVTYSSAGRHNSIISIALTQPEVMLSKTVAATFAKIVASASNKGPRYIIIEIDSPGGHGDCMKIICEGITQTTNCPVIAFISGGRFGGAYSAGAAVAMACDKVYMAPGAVIGSSAPIVTDATLGIEMADYYSTFRSPNLSAYGSYVATLARKNGRVGVLAMALIDASVEAIEVKTTKDGKSEFVDRRDKVPAQQLVRTWSRAGRSTVSSGYPAAQTLSGGMPLSMTAQEAIKAKMADKIAAGRSELLRELAAEDAKIIKGRQVASAIRKFKGAKRDVERLFAAVDVLKQRAATLEEQLFEARQRSSGRGVIQRSYRDRGVYGDEGGRISSEAAKGRINRRRSGYEGYGSAGRNQRFLNRYNSAAIARSEEALFFESQIGNELIDVLDELIANYGGIIAVVRRYPGAMPSGVTIASVQSEMNEAQSRINGLMM